MSTESRHSQLADWYGHREWPEGDESIPEPIPFAGRVVKCPACGHKCVRRGYHAHYWRRHGGGSKLS